VVAGSPTDAHRPLSREHDWAAILSHVEARMLTADYTIHYQGKIYQIARRHPSGIARQSGASGAARGRQPGGEVSRALHERDAVPTPALDGSAPEAGNDFGEGSLEGRPHLDEGLQPAEEPTAMGDHEVGHSPGSSRDRVGRRRFSQLTPVALRAPCVSREKQKAELSTLLRLGT
jgi:hypothetical protein